MTKKKESTKKFLKVLDPLIDVFKNVFTDAEYAEVYISM